MPAAIQNSLFSLSHMLVQSSVLAVNNAVVSQNSAFQPIVKGCSVCTSIESIACTVVNSIGQSAVPFIAQNSGAGNSCTAAVFPQPKEEKEEKGETMGPIHPAVFR